ncbi:MAG: NAD(+)/NADH kinase [Ignavibacteria bacterium]|nr:NAD(+)/NADH kinase [Ignavibacteria bacterium]
MKLGIIGNTGKEGLDDAVCMLVGKLRRSGIGFLIDREIVERFRKVAAEVGSDQCAGTDDCIAQSDMVVAFGGDGTILAAARSIGPRETPILGINLGKLGFLAELAPDEIEDVVGSILRENYVIEERMVLEGTFPQLPGTTIHALNDIVVDKARYSLLIDLETYIDDLFAVTYRADGLVISTPTGSTAYALSNGGPIVIPTSGVIGITPVAPHTLNGRPLIIPNHCSIRVVAKADGDEVVFYADGRSEVTITPPAEVVVREAKYKVRLVKRSDRSYFDVLRAKLLWGHDPRSADR